MSNEEKSIYMLHLVCVVSVEWVILACQVFSKYSEDIHVYYTLLLTYPDFSKWGSTYIYLSKQIIRFPCWQPWVLLATVKTILIYFFHLSLSNLVIMS